MLVGMLDEFGREDKQARQAEADAHTVDNSHVRKSISSADRGLDSRGQFTPVSIVS